MKHRNACAFGGASKGLFPKIGNPETIRNRLRNVSTSFRNCHGEDSHENTRVKLGEIIHDIQSMSENNTSVSRQKSNEKRQGSKAQENRPRAPSTETNTHTGNWEPQAKMREHFPPILCGWVLSRATGVLPVCAGNS